MSKIIKKVRKRDGRIADFDQARITNAIFAAAVEVGGRNREIAERLSDEVVKILEEKYAGEIPNVEDIQDVVEKVLIEMGHAKTAKAYILYRKQHEEMRKLKSTFFEVEHIVDDYLGMQDWRVKENSNVGYSLSGLLLHIAGSVIANYTLDRVYPMEVADAHAHGDFHVHDLGMGITGYCAGWSLSQLLAEGFNGVPSKVASRPPAHLDTALLQMVNFIGSLQNEWAGAQAFNSVDTLLAPFVRKDGLDCRQVKQAMQTFVFNLNIASRWGGQTPFTNITLDLTVPEDLASQHVTIGGKLGEKTYEEYTEEMEMINRALIEVMMEGDMNGRPFTFPIPTYSLTKDFEWDNGVSSALFEMTAKYGLPYFQNFINSDLKPSDVRSMCCHLMLDLAELRRNVTGGLFGSGDSTGSVGVVTVNMSRLGYLSKSEDEFFEKLGYIMELARISLEAKRDMVKKNMENGLLPFTKRYLGTLNNHFSTIGLVGMNEACLNLLDCSIAADGGKKFAVKTLKFMLGRIQTFQEETGNIYNLEATPAEGVSYRLAKIDKKKYSDIITAGERAPYYTNSTLLPVNSGLDLISALKHQEELQTLYTGGCVEKGNKVLTDRGLLNIEEIVENFEKLRPIRALSYNEELGISEWDEIVDVVAIDVKKHNKIRVKGERNLDITTSDWHPFLMLEKIKVNPACPICKKETGNLKSFAAHLRWNPECRKRYLTLPRYETVEKRADELKNGDYILQNSCNLYHAEPSELNDDLMWLVGFYIGDGCLSEFVDNRGGNNLKKYKVRFFSEHRPVLEKVAKILDKYFGCEVKVIQNDKRSKTLMEVSTAKEDVSEFLLKLGFKPGKKVYNVSAPKKVKENITKDNVFSLISGLMDSDGHLGKRDGDFEYQTASADLADDLLEIFTIAGIIISKKLKKTKRKNEVDIYRLRIPQYQLTKIKNKLNVVINPSRIKDNISNRKRRHLPVVRIKEVSKADVEENQFFDLTIEKNHNYLAGKDCLTFIHNTVHHIFLGESLEDGESCMNIVRKVSHNTRLPYFTVTPTYTICDDHGFIPGEYPKCPSCGKVTEVYSRVVGYFRPVRNWNVGKQEEFRQRIEYH